MPHLARTQEELDQLHPSLIAPDDEPLEDLATDAEDAVYQKGLELSEEIRRETSLHGRRKNPVGALLRRLGDAAALGGTLVTKHPSAGGRYRHEHLATTTRGRTRTNTALLSETLTDVLSLDTEHELYALSEEEWLELEPALGSYTVLAQENVSEALSSR